MSEIIATVEGVTKKFGNKIAVNNLSFNLYKNEIFVLLGPNGAGKTTTLKIMSGLLKPDTGRVMISTYDIQKDPIEAKKVIGLLPEQPYLYPKLSGFEFLNFICEIYKVNQDGIPEILNLLDLTEYSNQLIEKYSFGMKQKLLLASIILRNPLLYLLDEPFVGLDPKSSRFVREFFINLKDRCVVICTHILEIAEKIATRIAILHRGNLIAIDRKEELLYDEQRKKSLEEVFLELCAG